MSNIDNIQSDTLQLLEDIKKVEHDAELDTDIVTKGNCVLARAIAQQTLILVYQERVSMAKSANLSS
jgi:hypothetical protein